MKTIRETAALAGVAVSALRHYDEIGLLKPAARAGGGVRLYGREELLRLREILIWRQLGFALGDIARVLDDPGYDRAESLRRQLKLADEQLDRFRSISESVRTILALVDVGRPVSEDAVFAGFTRGPSFDRQADEEGPSRAEPRIATFSFLGHRSGASRLAGGQLPRIAATDPIRMAESVLALGILPVAAWSYPDRFDEASAGRDQRRDSPGTWPWPPLVESVVRARIGDLGIYGGFGGQRVIETRPDLVLTWEAALWQLPASRPPTEAFSYVPYQNPGFRTWLPEIAARLGLPGRGEALMARWQARTTAFRPHLAGRAVSVVNIVGTGESGIQYEVPAAGFESQIFTETGLRIGDAADRPAPGGREPAVIEPGELATLDAPVLFFGTYSLSREHVSELLASGPLRRLPAVRHGRAFDLGWAGARSGWFTSHWQLEQVARAYRLVQLRSADPLDTVYAVVDPATGAVGFSPAFRDMRVTVRGPRGAAFGTELRKGTASRVTIGPETAAHLCDFPEAYRISADDGSPGLAVALAHDRESALERVAAGLEAAA